MEIEYLEEHMNGNNIYRVEDIENECLIYENLEDSQEQISKDSSKHCPA